MFHVHFGEPTSALSDQQNRSVLPPRLEETADDRALMASISSNASRALQMDPPNAIEQSLWMATLPVTYFSSGNTGRINLQKELATETLAFGTIELLK